MEAAPLAALDLPLKVLVWADPERGTLVSYTAPAALAARYGLSPELEAALEPIDGLTDGRSSRADSAWCRARATASSRSATGQRGAGARPSVRRRTGQPRSGTGVAYSSSK